MRVVVNGMDLTNVRHDPRVAPHYGHLLRWAVLFVIGCTVLGPGIAFGVIAGWYFLPWVVGGFFLFTLVFFIRSTFHVSSAAKDALLERNADFREVLGRLKGAEHPTRRPVRMKTRCPNCGAAVSTGHITKIEGVPAVHCPYCDTLYPLEEAEPA
jgi:DNA-directed RNA polymerase subunit RPC12/RpoP